MKKILLSFLAIGALFTSCSNEDEIASDVTTGVKKTVSVTLNMPEIIDEGTRATEYLNSAKGGSVNLPNEKATFYIGFYYNNGTGWVLDENGLLKYEETDRSTEVTNVSLFEGQTYKMVAYAVLGSHAAVTDLAAIDVVNKVNDEHADTYFAVKNFTVTDNTKISASLSRPSGKIRFLAKDYYSYKKMSLDEIQKVSVVYNAPRYSKFNAVTGEYTGEIANTEAYENEYVIYSADTEAEGLKTVFVDYIPVNAGVYANCGFKVVVDYKLKSGEVKQKTKDLSDKLIKVYRNRLATVKASLWKVSVDVDITIDETLEGDVNDAAGLAEVLNNGGAATLVKDITLDEDYNITKDVTINLNGKTLTYTGDNVLFRVKDGGSVTINGQTAGSAVVTNPTTPSATGGNGYVVLVEAGGVATFNGGVYDAKQTCTIAQAKGGKVYVTDGEFSVDPTKYGTKYMFNHTDALKDVGLIEISGGKFHGYDPANSESENPVMSFVKAGYKSEETSTGVWTVSAE